MALLYPKLRRSKTNRHMSDEDWERYAESLRCSFFVDVFKVYAREKINLLDEELIKREKEFNDFQRKDENDLRRSLRLAAHNLFKNDIAREKLKLGIYPFLPKEINISDLNALRAIPLTNVFAFQKLRVITPKRSTALCPFHEEKTPSFVVFTNDDETTYFHCFGCNLHGDIFTFIMKLNDCSFKVALAHLKNMV